MPAPTNDSDPDRSCTLISSKPAEQQSKNHSRITKLVIIGIAVNLILAASSATYLIITNIDRQQSFIPTTTPLISSTQSTPREISPHSTNYTREFFPHSAEDEKRIRELVDEINGKNLSWKAEYNPFAAIKGRPEPYGFVSVDYSALKLDGLSQDDSRAAQVLQDTVDHLTALASHSTSLPSSYDPRETWSLCSSAHNIQDQGGCGACWAAAATGALSDRLCISTNYTKQRMLSTQDLVACCEFCGGCQGAMPIIPLLYWKMRGLVSGGSFGTNEGCRPYEAPSTCGHPCPPYFAQAMFNPTCERKCQQLYDGKYEDELEKGRTIYYIKMSVSYNDHWLTRLAYAEYERTIKTLNVSSIDLIKRELFLHGPVIVGLPVTEAFMHYRSGVYSAVYTDTHQNTTLHYGHAMKLLGWGEENGKEYWIVANSWGRQWGEGGFGRISIDYYPSLMSIAAGLW